MNGCSTTSSAAASSRTWTREGNRGTTLSPAWPAHTPIDRLFGQATPGPRPTLGPRPQGACSDPGRLLIGAEPAGAQPASRWSPARVRGRRGRGQDRPNGQMNRSSPRTDRVAEPSVKIAGPAQPMSAPSPLRAPRVLDEDRRGSNWRCRQRAAGVRSDLRNTSGRRALVDEIGLDSTPAACRCAGGGSHVLIVVVVRAADTDHLLLRRERLSSATDRGPCRCAGVTKRLVGCRALEPCH
jgi:hypothetical protein